MNTIKKPKRIKSYKTVEQLEEEFYADLFMELRTLATSIFEWHNLPEGMRSEQIEEYLFEKGQIVFFQDDNGSFLALPFAHQARLNVYGEPVAWQAMGATGQSWKRNIDNSVLIRNRHDRQPSRPRLEYLCLRLTDIELTIINNQNWVKTPYVFKGQEKDMKSFKTLFTQISGNHPAIYLDRELATDNFDVHNTGVEWRGAELVKLKHEYLNDIYTLLGIKNANTDKKERMIVDEVNANNQQIEANLNARLRMRQEAVEAINEMFGLEIEVKVRPQFEDTPEATEEPERKEGDEDV